MVKPGTEEISWAKAMIIHHGIYNTNKIKKPNGDGTGEETYSYKFMWSKLNYIHMNLVRVGIVEKASNYIYSSAPNYVIGRGLVTIELVDGPIYGY